MKKAIISASVLSISIILSSVVSSGCLVTFIIKKIITKVKQKKVGFPTFLFIYLYSILFYTRNAYCIRDTSGNVLFPYASH